MVLVIFGKHPIAFHHHDQFLAIFSTHICQKRPNRGIPVFSLHTALFYLEWYILTQAMLPFSFYSLGPISMYVNLD